MAVYISDDLLTIIRANLIFATLREHLPRKLSIGCGALNRADFSLANEPKSFSLAMTLCDAGLTLSSASVVNG